MLLETGDYWEPDQGDIIKWQRAYKKVDVHQELSAMDAWLDANPTRRKTKVGMNRFVNSWLKRSDDQGGASPVAKQYAKTLRGMTLDMQLTDITWLNPEDQQMMKGYYLAQRGFYYDGELKSA